MDDEVADLLRMLIAGLNQMADAQRAQSQMTAKILQILSAPADGPNPIAETLRAVVAAVRANQAGIEKLELNSDEMLPVVYQIAIAMRKLSS